MPPSSSARENTVNLVELGRSVKSSMKEGGGSYLALRSNLLY